MSEQCTSTLLMIRPVSFRMNEQTARNNYYQKVIDGLDPDQVQNMALTEFDAFVDKLRSKGIKVIVVDDTPEPDTPDSIFPNNWVSFHSDGRIGLYPMFAENRRTERREEIFDMLSNEYNLLINELVDFTEFEEHEKFLEGTGSMVLDRVNRIAYAAISPRTDEPALLHFCEEFDYTPEIFHAYQTVGEERLLIYHTNVMMCIADNFAIVCLDCVDDDNEKASLKNRLEKSGKKIIEITEDQVNRFAGNMLQICNSDGDKFLVMSESAFSALTPDQRLEIEGFNPIISSSLDTIEACGGGSARCMMAEVFLPQA